MKDSVFEKNEKIFKKVEALKRKIKSEIKKDTRNCTYLVKKFDNQDAISKQDK